MIVDRFLEKFDVFANTPHAVEKLREIVIELAVQGKLVQQDETEEPASRIVERAVALANGKKSPKRNISMDDGALPPLPVGWAWTCNAVIGDTSPRVSAANEAPVAFAPMNVIPTDYRAALVPEVRPWGEIKKGYTHFADGDIAVAKITPCFQNGKACVMKDLPGGVGAGTTELHVLRPYPKTVEPLYMLLFFKSPEFVRGGVATFTGTAGQQRVSNDYFRFRPVPLPPLAEQKRIVAKVDELMALCDALEAQQQERQTRHAALAHASLARFADQPTPDNLNFLFHKSYDITPVDLRNAILTLAFSGGLSSKFSDGRMPVQWDTPTIELISESISPGFACSKGHQVANGHVHLRTHNISTLGTLNFDLMVRIDPKKVDPQKKAIRAGDILFNNTNSQELVGKTSLVDRDYDYGFSNHITRIRLKECAFPGFVAHYLTYLRNCGHFSRLCTRWINQAAINTSLLKQQQIPLPPVVEQRRIVAKVDQLMALVDELEAQLAAERSAAAALMDALVAELTAPRQDPE